MSESASLVGMTSNQPFVAELDTISSINQPSQDLIGLIELDSTCAGVVSKHEPVELPALIEPLRQHGAQRLDPLERAEAPRNDTKDQPGLEVVDIHAPVIRNSDKDLVNGPAASVTNDPQDTSQQPEATAVDRGNPADEPPDDNKSVMSSVAPSIFSHSSSFTGATGGSLPGITEEDMHARHMLSEANIKTSRSASLQTLRSPIHGNDAESIRLPQLSSVSSIDEPDEQGFPWVVQAARDGNEDIVRKLLVSGADIRATHTSTQRHALAEAALQGHQAVSDLLIEEGCPLESADAEGDTALHHACRNGHLAIAKSLILRGAPINTPGSQGRSALHLAMEAPFQNLVMLLIQHKANVNARDAAFRTPLHVGASQGNVAMCSHLLNEGAQLDSREAQSKTPLQLACEGNHYDLVQMMLVQSKLNASNMTFLTTFFAAVEHGHVRITESFFSQGLKLPELKRDHHKPLTLAAKSGSLDMVELMIQEGCNTNAKDERGWNALHFASYHGQYQIIEQLFAGGVSAKATTSRKETPLLLAVKGSHFPVVERLLRSDNDNSLISAEDERGQQPVHHAVRAGSLEIFNLLMSNGVKINVENAFGWQSLHIATAYGHLALVERLLQQGANIEEKLGSSSIKKDQTHRIVEEGYWAEARWPYPGSRALHLACEYGHEEIAKCLISKGAKMDSSCGEGWQPLHHAAYFGSSILVETLLQGGVNPHATTNEGKTASSLGYCTTGAPIAEDETAYIQNMLSEAMNRVKKPKNFKVALKKASTAEDKSNFLRAATFSMSVVALRPPLHKAKTTVQAIQPDSVRPESVSPSMHRPRLSHISHTSPLPATTALSDLSTNHSPSPNLPGSHADKAISALPSKNKSSSQSTDTVNPKSPSDSRTSSTIERTSQSSNPTTNTTKTAETQLSTQPPPKLKRRTTFGLAKVGKTGGLDMGKLSLGGAIGKPTFEIGKSTLEIGNKTLEFGKQGLEGFGDKSRQGLEMGKKSMDQGKDLGKRGVEASKSGYKKAKKFAMGKGRKKDGVV
ncbi:MAG: hypothetical protein Q9222_007261, partial [Ikaeria aurantiellina]